MRICFRSCEEFRRSIKSGSCPQAQRNHFVHAAHTAPWVLHTVLPYMLKSCRGTSIVQQRTKFHGNKEAEQVFGVRSFREASPQSWCLSPVLGMQRRLSEATRKICNGVLKRKDSSFEGRVLEHKMTWLTTWTVSVITRYRNISQP